MAEERSAFLANACAGDETLRREVESLLVASEYAGARPKCIGRYEIVSPIGVGGMGTVYKARTHS